MSHSSRFLIFSTPPEYTVYAVSPSKCNSYANITPSSRHRLEDLTYRYETHVMFKKPGTVVFIWDIPIKKE
jgi:hypothetical protein